MYKKSRFRGHFGERHGEREQALLRSGGNHFYHSYSTQWTQVGWKKSLLLICKVLQVFVNGLPARDKYSIRNRDNWMEPIQMQLSQKQETLSKFFFAFLKSTLNFKSFPRKGDPHSWCISEITGSEKRD